MQFLQKLWFALGLLLIVSTASGQFLNVSLPIDGAVYQQNQQNQGKIIVQGNFNTRSFLFGISTTVTASLQKLDLVTGNPTGDAPIQFSLTRVGNTFSGARTVDKGWYELSVSAVRAFLPPPIRTTTVKRKVGIGEVFIIAGQSNAQGGFNISAPNTQYMDAVRVSSDVIADLGSTDPNNLPESFKRIQSLVPIGPGAKIGPTGPTLWYWGSVGAKIAQQCQAPVAIFNAAYVGTTITNWQSSIDPNARTSGQTPSDNIEELRYKGGSPFGFFGNMFRMYASTYGVRAVLWMQGEGDTKAIFDVQRSGDPIKQGGWADRALINRNNAIITVPLPFSDNGLEKRWVRDEAQYRDKLKAVIGASRSLLNNPSNQVERI